MGRKTIVASVVAIAILLLSSILFIGTRPSRPPITVRHVKSSQDGNVTTMSFEVTNHTADGYIFSPFQVQVRNGSGWSKFQDFDITKIHPTPTLTPRGVASYTVKVADLPAGSVVRFSVRPQKILLGVNGFVRRAELNLRKQGGGGGMPLNPYDKNSQVFGSPTEPVVTEEFIEPEPK